MEPSYHAKASSCLRNPRHRSHSPRPHRLRPLRRPIMQIHFKKSQLKERHKECLQRSFLIIGNIWMLYFDDVGLTQVNVTPLVGKPVPLCIAVCTDSGPVIVQKPSSPNSHVSSSPQITVPVAIERLLHMKDLETTLLISK